MVVDFAITCLSASYGSCSSSTDFDLLNHGGTAAGVEVVDPNGRRVYRVVRDGQDRPFTSALSGVGPDVGAPAQLAWAVFPVPPQSVSSVDVLFPQGGPQISGVPVTQGAGPSATALGPGVVAAEAAPFAEPLGSTSTTGLKLSALALSSTVGNPAASVTQTPQQATVTLSADVLFAFDQSTLTAVAQGELIQLAARLRIGADGLVKVTGYTDSIGPDTVNQALSAARAQSVVAALIPKVRGAPITFQAAGDGANDPVAPNSNSDGSDNPAGRALNRRVTITYSTTKPVAPLAPPSSTAKVPAGTTKRTVRLSAPGGSSLGTSSYAITVQNLSRSGGFVVLQLTLTCTGRTGEFSTIGCASGDDFAAEGLGFPPVAANLNPGGMKVSGVVNDANTASAIYLTDPETMQDYGAVHDSTGVPLSGGIDPNMHTGYTWPVWEYFAAPPPSTTSMTVVLPDDASGIIVPIPAA